MCINWNLYTRGTNEQYDKMFRKCKDWDGSIEGLSLIAGDIFDHSDFEGFEEYGVVTVAESIALIMTQLARTCVCITYESEEVE